MKHKLIFLMFISIPFAFRAIAQDLPREFEEELKQFPDGWLAEKAERYGMDITLDGKIWINMDTYGDEVDYSVAASDLLQAQGTYRTAWIRGYHARDESLPYSESKRLLHLDCRRARFSEELVVYYDGDGKLLESYGPTESRPVVPGSLAAQWMRFICNP